MNKINYCFTPMPKYARTLLSPNAYMLLSFIMDEWQKADNKPFQAANSFFQYLLGISQHPMDKAIRELEYYCLISRDSVGKGNGKVKSTWTVLTKNFDFWENISFKAMREIKERFSQQNMLTKTTLMDEDNLVSRNYLLFSQQNMLTMKEYKDIRPEYNIDHNIDIKEISKEKNKEIYKEIKKESVSTNRDFKVLTEVGNKLISTSKEMLTASLEDKEQKVETTKDEETSGSNLENNKRDGSSVGNKDKLSTKKETTSEGTYPPSTKGLAVIPATVPAAASNHFPVKDEWDAMDGKTKFDTFKSLASRTGNYLYKNETRLGSEPYSEYRDIVRDFYRQFCVPEGVINRFISNCTNCSADTNLDWRAALESLRVA